MKKVLVFGTFDLLHPGHLYFLEQARRHGNKLVVVVTRDEVVKKLKRKKPALSERDRVAMEGALRMVDDVLLGDRLGECKVVLREKPDVIVYGHDQIKDIFGLTKQLLQHQLKIKTFRAESWNRRKFSSSRLRSLTPNP